MEGHVHQSLQLSVLIELSDDVISTSYRLCVADSPLANQLSYIDFVAASGLLGRRGMSLIDFSQAWRARPPQAPLSLTLITCVLCVVSDSACAYVFTLRVEVCLLSTEHFS